MNILKKTIILAPIIALIQVFTGQLGLVLIISLVLSIISLVLFIVYGIKSYKDTFKENLEDNVYIKKHIENLSKTIIFGIILKQHLILGIINLIVCSCGEFLINIVPVTVAMFIEILYYFIFIKKSINKEDYTGSDLISDILITSIIIGIGLGIGFATYSHYTINAL